MALINRISWKMVVIVGGGAFALSFLLGLVTGNYIGICLLRAILFGFIFSLLTIGSDLLLKHFCPELFQAEGVFKSPPSNGKRVDLVLEDTPDLKTTDLFASDEESLATTTTGEGLESEVEEAPPAEESSFNKEALDVLGVEEEAQPIKEYTETEIIPNLDGQTLSAPEQEATVQKKNDKINDKVDDLDTLPDLSSFESVFSPVTGDNSSVVTESFTTDLSSPTLKSKRLDQDPVTYAKALRTILKRDEGKNK